MNVRPASFRDLAHIEHLYRSAVASTDHGTPLTANSPVPDTGLVRLWYALSKTLSSLMPISDNSDALFVAEDHNDIIGFIQAQSSGTKPKSWQILNLCAVPDGRGHFASERLLAALMQRGQECGINRFHVRLPLDHPLITLFLEQGFNQFATEQILYADELHIVTETDGADLRPARRDDVGAIYLLYLRTTPSEVASIEGPNQKTWTAGFSQGLLARIGKDDVHHLVAERSGIYGWAAIRSASGASPTMLALMCEGQDPEARDHFIDAVIAELPAGPISCVLRHYDSELIRALQQRGFAIYGTQLLLVRDLSVRIPVSASKSRKKPVLVPAGIAQSMPLRSRSQLRVLSTVPVDSRRNQSSLR